MRQIRPYSSRRRHGFTLIEIMIALSLFLVLLAVIFIPLNQAFQVFNAGRTSIALQGAADNTVKTIAAELQGAIAVYPNDDLPGITDHAPYQKKLPAAPGQSLPPYFEKDAGTCGEADRVANTARIDFILPTRGADGSVASPVKPQPYIVTYFAQRQKANTAPLDRFDEFSNPIGIYRTRMMYQDGSGAPLANKNTKDTRYEATGCNSDWLRQVRATTPEESSPPPDPPPFPYRAAEPQIPTDTSATGTDEHTLISPRDMGVNVNFVPDPADPSNPAKATMQPDLNFTCEDVDSNGVIDRVTITLTLVQYEENNGGAARRRTDASGKTILAGQRVTASQVVNLPNTRLGV